MSAPLLVVAATAQELVGAEGLEGVELLACGIGPVDAGIAVATWLAHAPRPRALLHVGIAGMRRGANLAIGQLVVGESARYADTQSHLVIAEVPTLDMLVAALAEALPGAVRSPIATSADVAGGGAACDVEAMEGFAVLRAAQIAGVPAVELRAISNEVEEQDRSRWRFQHALDALATALPSAVRAVQATVADGARPA